MTVDSLARCELSCTFNIIAQAKDQESGHKMGPSFQFFLLLGCFSLSLSLFMVTWTWVLTGRTNQLLIYLKGAKPMKQCTVAAGEHMVNATFIFNGEMGMEVGQKAYLIFKQKLNYL